MRQAGKLRLRGWHARTVDVAVVFVVAAIGQQEAWLPVSGLSMPGGPRWLFALVSAATSAALWWRRSHPMTVVLFVTAAFTVHGLAVGWVDGLAPLLPMLLGLFCVARWADRRAFLCGSAGVAVGCAVRFWRDPHYHPGPALGLTIMPIFILAAAAVIGRVLRARAGTLAAVQARADRGDSDRAAVVSAAVHAERKRIARELHDIVGHGLSLAAVQVMGAQASLETAAYGEAGERMANVEHVIRATLAEMRRLMSLDAEASTDFQPQPGVTDIRRLVEQVRSSGLPITLYVDPELPSLSAAVQLAVYRVVQECLTNVVRHAAAPARATVRIYGDHGRVAVQVCDEAAGPTPTVVAGRGLTGMRERVVLFGGSFDVRCTERGVMVRACLPADGALL